MVVQCVGYNISMDGLDLDLARGEVETHLPKDLQQLRDAIVDGLSFAGTKYNLPRAQLAELLDNKDLLEKLQKVSLIRAMLVVVEQIVARAPVATMGDLSRTFGILYDKYRLVTGVGFPPGTSWSYREMISNLPTGELRNSRLTG